jgi:hypothetical protein
MSTAKTYELEFPPQFNGPAEISPTRHSVPFGERSKPEAQLPQVESLAFVQLRPEAQSAMGVQDEIAASLPWVDADPSAQSVVTYSSAAGL